MLNHLVKYILLFLLVLLMLNVVFNKKWTFPQRRMHYVQYQYFLFYILLIWRVQRTQRSLRPLPTGLASTDRHLI